MQNLTDYLSVSMSSQIPYIYFILFLSDKFGWIAEQISDQQASLTLGFIGRKNM